MNRLVRLYASNLLKTETIIAAGDDLTKLSFVNTGLLADENLGLGNDLWVHLGSMEEEYDPSSLYRAVRSFYVASLQKMLKKFPFGDLILKDLDVINPDRFCVCSFSTLDSLAKRFPQLGLDDSSSLNLLREEYMNFSLSDHPSVSTYTSATGEKPRSGAFRCEVGNIKTIDGKPRFPNLAKLMAGLLSIPASNADSERGLSILR